MDFYGWQNIWGINLYNPETHLKKKPRNILMSENKCSKCRVKKRADNFDEGKASCKKCIGEKEVYRENHREELRQKPKEYYEKNKAEILEKKEYREQNRDKILESKKKHREEHKEGIKDKRKEYYENNTDEILEKQKQCNDLKTECVVCKCFVKHIQWNVTKKALSINNH